jgi:lysophospholipase L1-like esterase
MIKTKITITALTLIAIICNSNLYAAKTNVPAAKRENIEWTDVWLTNCTKDNKPHVLLVGDSITKGYYNGVAKQLKAKAYTGRFATSLCVADPAYIPTLKAVLLQVDFDVIHFNNGLHGVDYTEEQYAEGYRNAINTIKEIQPGAKIIVTLSTPLKKGSNKEHLNPRIDKRNQIATKIAKQNGAAIDDLNTPMRNHPEYHRDPYHYKGKAIAMQATQVAASISSTLEK